MKILLVNQFFWPDSAATSQLLTDVARVLAAHGHEVHAVCGSSRYAGGAATPESSAPETLLPGVQIRRTPALPFSRGLAGRVLSYASFLATAGLEGLRGPRPDVVLTLTTPPLVSWVGTLLRRCRGSRHFIWEMDVYPDIAVDLGVLRKGGVLERLVAVLADSSRNTADGVIVLGECMRDRLIGRGVPADRLHVAENWADGRQIQPAPFETRPELHILYSGNLGLAHDIDTVSSAMLALKTDDRFRFIFAGGGPRRPALEQWAAAHELTHVSFQAYRSRQDLGTGLNAGDIGLVTQRPDCLGSVVPSKVYGLMAAGRPILFVGPRRSTAALVIERHNCGWHIEPGDTAALVGLLGHLSDRRDLVHSAGARGRLAFEQNYDLPLGTQRIAEILGALKKDNDSLPAASARAGHSGAAVAPALQ